MFSKNEYTLLRDYFIKCLTDAFKNQNDFSRVSKEREYFYRWHLIDLIKKFSKARDSEVIFVSLNSPEVKTACAMFQRVDCDLQMQKIQRRITKHNFKWADGAMVETD